MKVAIVRGPSLNQWEMQNYEPLVGKYEVLAIGAKEGAYDISQIKLPIKRLVCLGNISRRVPGAIRCLYRVWGDTQCLLGFNHAVFGLDIVHTAETVNYYSLQSVRAKRRGLIKAVVVTVWENIPFLGEDNSRRARIKREVRANADCFLAVTKAAREALLKEGVDADKIRVVPMGVDTTKFKPQAQSEELREELRLRRDKKVILFVGRLVKEKGIYDLVQALNRLKERGDWQAVFVGAGPEKRPLVEVITGLGLSARVIFTVTQPYERMPEVFNLADVLVLPSVKTRDWEEQYGMVLIEAMACGKVVVASRGAPEGVVGGVGIVVPQSDPVALSRVLSRLLDNGRERERRGREGRRRVEALFDARKIAKDIGRIYEDIYLVATDDIG